jgi:hypothetical protein
MEANATAEQTATVPAPETTPAAAPEAAPTSNPAPASANGGEAISVGSAEDAYTKALKDRLEKLAEKEAEGKTVDEPKPAPKEGKTHDEKRGEWWKEKSPDQKSEIKLRQYRDKIEASEKRIAELEEKLKSAAAATEPKSKEREQFATDEEWVDYRAENKLLDLLKRREAEAAEAAQAQERNRANVERWQKAMERDFPNPEEREAATELFQNELNHLKLDASVKRYIVESGSPRLLLHLVRHPSAQEMLKPGTSELLVGTRLAKIESYLASKTTKSPAAQDTPTTQTRREPALTRASGSANKIGNAPGIGHGSREAELRERQRQLFGLS